MEVERPRIIKAIRSREEMVIPHLKLYKAKVTKQHDFGIQNTNKPQIYRTIEYNRRPEINPYLYSNLIFEQKYYEYVQFGIEDPDIFQSSYNRHFSH